MITDALRKRTTQAMKEKDDVAKDVLRLALGEIQTAEARAGRAVTEEEAVAIVRKLVKSNEETLAAGGASGDAADGPRATTLRREIALLTELLPATLTVPQIVLALASQTEALRAAKGDGQATGIAMRHLKTTGAAFDGTDVTAAVKQIRA
jgi:uncharacterized protein YqeY